MSPASGDLPGSGWRDAMECLGVRDAVAAILVAVAADVEAALVCGVVYL